MEKAKTMLVGIAVVALVGGALAFKAAKFDNPNLYTCAATTVRPGAPIVCTLTTCNAVAGLFSTNPNLLYTTCTTNHLGLPDCTIIIGAGIYGCYDHPIHAYLNR